MMKRRAHPKLGVLSLTVALLPSLLLSSCSDDSPVGTTHRTFLEGGLETAVEEDIVYGQGAVRSPETGEVDLHLDLYQPTGEGDPQLRPAFVSIHGGGFSGGTRKNAAAVSMAQSYAQRGYVAVSIDYRLVGDDPPTEDYATDPGDPYSVAEAAARIDAAKAIQWLRDNAAEYRIDPDRIAVSGYSAGAITALGLAFREDGPDAAQVGAVVSLAGALNEDVSIIDAQDPPLVLVNGVDDNTIALDRAQAIATRASEVGLAHEFYALEGVGHGVPAELGTVVDGVSVSERIVNFLYEHLALENLAGGAS